MAAGTGAAWTAQRAPSTAQVVRAWSAALNANHNAAAAKLFAPNAEIIQGTLDVRLTSPGLALAFNDSLPCAGRIVALKVTGLSARATFVLGQRPKHRCSGPGEKAAALIVVRAGKIVLWAQIPVPSSKPTA
jgi:limonene-1,2-epoxide hydrolase